MAQAVMAVSNEAPRVFIICDPGPDPDDAKVLLAAGMLHREASIVIEGVVANGGHQAMERARLAKALLNAACARDVRVGFGTPGVPRAPEPHEYRVAGYEAVRCEDIRDGHELLMSVLVSAAPASLVVQCQSGLTDIARAMQEDGKLFAEKVIKVSVQAGLIPCKVSLAHPHGWAPSEVQNNFYDMEAASFVYNFCFEHRITMHVLDRGAVPPIPMTAATSIAESTGCPILTYLADCQVLGLAQLWRKVCSGSESSLPPFATKEWFFITFCGVDASTYAEKYYSLGEGCSIVEHLNGSVQPYDLVAFMTVVPGCVRVFDFTKAAVQVNGIAHFFFLKEEHRPATTAVLDFLDVIFSAVAQSTQEVID